MIPRSLSNAISFQQNRTRHGSIARHRARYCSSSCQSRRASNRSLRPCYRGGRRRSRRDSRGGGPRGCSETDLSISGEPQRLRSRFARLSAITWIIFVSNAGISKAASIEDHTIEDFDNLFARMCAAPLSGEGAMPLFGEGSNIVMVSSLAARATPGNPGQPGTPSLPAYAPKGAIETLVKHWAAALGPRGIRVECRRSRRDRNGHVQLHED